jgi:hypothetical protein
MKIRLPVDNWCCTEMANRFWTESVQITVNGTMRLCLDGCSVAPVFTFCPWCGEKIEPEKIEPEKQIEPENTP